MDDDLVVLADSLREDVQALDRKIDRSDPNGKRTP